MTVHVHLFKDSDTPFENNTEQHLIFTFYSYDKLRFQQKLCLTV